MLAQATEIVEPDAEPLKPTGIVPRATIQAICAQRDRALALYADAHAALLVARDVGRKAYDAMMLANDRKTNSYNSHHINERAHYTSGDNANFLMPISLPEAAEYAKDVRAMIDRQVWAHIIELSDLERIMDKTAKDEFRKQLADDPPECTVENVQATLQAFASDSGTIFARGIAKCFSELDRRFRSHDAFKIGARVILDRAFDDWGSWSHYTNKRDSLIDIERVFVILDGKNIKAIGGGVVHQVETERRAGAQSFGKRQSEHDSDYFRIRVYKNGNLHIWFTRDDLVRDVNRLLGKYYGEQVPDATEPEDDGGLYEPKRTLAKNFGFFPTPDDTVGRVMDKFPLYRSAEDSALVCLEPSAGTGQLATVMAATQSHDEWEGRERKVRRYKATVDCIEIQPAMAHALRLNPRYRKVTCADFLTVQPEPVYDRIAMNPPFDRERDIDHVVHALKFLKPSGFLCAIMSAGTEFRDTRKSIAFRKLMDDMNARWEDLPLGSFSSVGTNVNTRILRVWNDKRRHYL